MNKTKFCFFVFLLVTGMCNVDAQNPARFKDQIEQLTIKDYQFNPDNKLVVFAGSSSIRMWKDVQDYFPDFNVINNGFGGSQFSDLIFYTDQLILKPKPEILFIYEGDNDIASGKKPSSIAKEAKYLLQNIQGELPETEIILISVKPSIARWTLKKNYEKLNKRLRRLAKRTDKVEYANVWDVMIDQKGNLYQDIFLDDGVHMNKKGYDLWSEEIKNFLR
mgnify:CR=1 FL=1